MTVIFTGSSGGATNAGVVFQLKLSGGHWAETTLHAFRGGAIDGSDPAYLVQDSAGNLYGIAPDSWIFALEKTFSGFDFIVYIVGHGSEFEDLNNLRIDAAGNVYGTGAGG